MAHWLTQRRQGGENREWTPMNVNGVCGGADGGGLFGGAFTSFPRGISPVTVEPGRAGLNR